MHLEKVSLWSNNCTLEEIGFSEIPDLGILTENASNAFKSKLESCSNYRFNELDRVMKVTKEDQFLIFKKLNGEMFKIDQTGIYKLQINYPVSSYSIKKGTVQLYNANNLQAQCTFAELKKEFSKKCKEYSDEFKVSEF